MAVDLAFTEQGEGAPLVILHGLFGWKRNWAGLTTQFAKTHRVLVIDARNHGESPNVPEMNYDAMAGDLIQFIEVQVGGPARVMGHSMGGKAAMVAALSRPELFEQLIICDIAPVSYQHTYHDHLKAMQGVDLVNIARRQDADVALAGSIPQADVRGLLLQNLERANGEGFQWRINLDAIAAGHDHLTAFPEIPEGQKFEGPTLFIRGSTSDYVSDQYEPKIQPLFPNARIETVEGAGHWLHAEKPEDFFEKAQAFLDV
jgi:pimeloyl-ACP methyl ester carboxylesterase